jgi:hypothetical protein
MLVELVSRHIVRFVIGEKLLLQIRTISMEILRLLSLS